MSKEKKDRVHEEFEGLEPLKPFYLAASTYYIDDSLKIDGEGIEGVSLDLDEVTQSAHNYVEEYGQEDGAQSIVYRCVPILLVKRGRVIVKKLAGKP